MTRKLTPVWVSSEKITCGSFSLFIELIVVCRLPFFFFSPGWGSIQLAFSHQKMWRNLTMCFSNEKCKIYNLVYLEYQSRVWSDWLCKLEYWSLNRCLMKRRRYRSLWIYLIIFSAWEYNHINHICRVGSSRVINMARPVHELKTHC